MHVVCVLFLISWIAYYQRRLQRLFPVVWKDSVEHTGNNALGSYFFFFSFFFIIIKKSKIKKEKEKKTFFKLLARWSPARPVPWAVCLPVHHCYPVSGRMLLTGQTPLPRRPPPLAPPQGGRWARHTASSLTSSALDSNADLPAMNSCSSKSHLQPNSRKSSV